MRNRIEGTWKNARFTRSRAKGWRERGRKGEQTKGGLAVRQAQRWKQRPGAGSPVYRQLLLQLAADQLSAVCERSLRSFLFLSCSFSSIERFFISCEYKNTFVSVHVCSHSLPSYLSLLFFSLFLRIKSCTTLSLFLSLN